MDDLVKSAGRTPEIWRAPEYCPYCGAALSPGFYFCLVCATPYKAPESVLAHLRPIAPSEGMLIAKKAPHVFTVFWTYLAVIVSVGVVSMFFREESVGLQLVLGGMAMLVTTSVFASLHWRSLAVQLKCVGFDHWAAYVGLAALAPLLGASYLYHGWITDMLGGRSTDVSESLREAGLGRAGLILFVCVFPAVLEEIAFRGLIQHWLQIAVRPLTAIVLASALFMALHFSVISVPYLFAVGMTLGWVKWKTRSLYPCMLIHFLHNLVVIEVFPT